MARTRKTKKALTKRLKVTGRGKVIGFMPGAGHLKSRKTPKQLRRYRKGKAVSECFQTQAKQLMQVI